jgi:signal transduction histidine kinase
MTAIMTLQAIMDTVRQPLVLLDGDLRMKTANRAFYQTFRLGPEEIGKPLLSQLSQAPGQLSCLGKLCQAVASGDREYQDHQLEHEFPGLGHRLLLVNARRVPMEDSQAPLVVLALEDVTERARMATALRSTEAKARSLETERLAAIGQVSAGLTHESRNALQRGQASLEMLRREVQDRPAALQLIAQLEQAQDDLLHLFEGVGEYAAPMKLQLKKQCLDTVVQGTWEQLRGMRGQRVIDFRLDGRGMNTSCEIDGRRLSQVFRNILENSLLACTDPVGIDVSFQEAMLGERAALRISLRNNGPPLTWEERRKIFEAFFTTRTHGSGLGMAIAKRIVEAHGGWLEVGPPEQQGVEILITLPRGGS